MVSDISLSRFPVPGFRWIGGLFSGLLLLGGMHAPVLAGQKAVTPATEVPPMQSYPHAGWEKALERYRALSSSSAWSSALPLPASGKVEDGQPYEGLGLLQQRLQLLGDLGQPVPDSTTAYTGPVVEAVKAFQARHGLLVDGVLGRRTLRQMDVPPARRVAQLQRALQRGDVLGGIEGERLVVVNVPEFMLRAYVREAGVLREALEMRVIVGESRKTRTPLFVAPMRYIEFSPRWNVPSSIAHKELVPRLRSDPAHFDSEGFEFVWADGTVDGVLSKAALDAVMEGGARIRQRPGPKNALGDIKFGLPNDDAIYLHHTPSVRLFDRSRRDFSHGCVRVEDPVALAMFVLHGQEGWDEARIRAAMESGDTSFLRIKQPVPVVIDYDTVRVDESGRAYFFADVYEHDSGKPSQPAM